jgi:hypothetical protein
MAEWDDFGWYFDDLAMYIGGLFTVVGRIGVCVVPASECLCVCWLVGVYMDFEFGFLLKIEIDF